MTTSISLGVSYGVCTPKQTRDCKRNLPQVYESLLILSYRDTSLTDPWARMISYHFLNGTSRSNFFTNDSAHGAGQLWSKIPFIPSFQQHLMPFPLVVANSRPVGSNLTSALPPDPIVYEVRFLCSSIYHQSYNPCCRLLRQNLDLGILTFRPWSILHTLALTSITAHRPTARAVLQASTKLVS